jgi:hypothetical protein
MSATDGADASWKSWCLDRRGDRVSETERERAEFAMRVCVSAIFVVVGFAVLMFGVGQDSSAKMAAGWLGAVLGFWLR